MSTAQTDPSVKRAADSAESAARVAAAADTSGGPETRKDPLVCVVVPVFNRLSKTMRFLLRMRDLDYANFKIIIVDDGSSDGTGETIGLNRPDVAVLRGDGDLWWSGGTNMGVEHALKMNADYILTINDDCEMEPDFLRQMVDVARRNPKYIVGCRLQCHDEREVVWSIGTTAVFRGGELYALNFAGKRWADLGHLPDPYPTDTLCGNGVLIPAAVFREVGLYDRRNMPQYHADSDLVLRAREAGYKPVVSLRSVIYNDILTEPLVTNRIDLVFSRKSDRYWRAVWTTVRRHAPWRRRRWVFYRQYTPFFFNSGLSGLIKKRLRRYLEQPPQRPPETDGGLVHEFNPTCSAGPTKLDATTSK